MENIGLKIKNISEKELIHTSMYSSIHKVKIDDSFYLLKETIEPAWPIKNVIDSYKNYQSSLTDIDEIVKIYDFELIDNKAVLLMEYLEDYENLIKKVVPSVNFKDVILEQILNLFLKMWERGFINYDFTIINFLIKDEKIKMIDLEFIANINNLSLFRLLWFCERIDIVKNWHGNSYDRIMKIKEEVMMKWKSNENL